MGNYHQFTITLCKSLNHFYKGQQCLGLHSLTLRLTQYFNLKKIACPHAHTRTEAHTQDTQVTHLSTHVQVHAYMPDKLVNFRIISRNSIHSSGVENIYGTVQLRQICCLTFLSQSKFCAMHSLHTFLCTIDIALRDHYKPIHSLFTR